jgi:hypothetical protein
MVRRDEGEEIKPRKALTVVPTHTEILTRHVTIPIRPSSHMVIGSAHSK